VPGHRQFAARREDAHAHIGVRRTRRQHEGGLGERHLQRDGLHLGFIDCAGIREHRKLVAAQRAVGEHVQVQVTMGWHRPGQAYLRHAGLLRHVTGEHAATELGDKKNGDSSPNFLLMRAIASTSGSEIK